MAWKQGKNWIVVKAPFKTRADLLTFDYKPKGVKTRKDARSAYDTIQRIRGDVPEELRIDMGIMDVTIKSPGKPGKKGSIAFRRDPFRKTKGDISFKGAGRGLSGRPLGRRSHKSGKLYITGRGRNKTYSRRPLRELSLI